MLDCRLLRDGAGPPERMAMWRKDTLKPVAHIRRHAAKNHTVRKILKGGHAPILRLPVLVAFGDVYHSRPFKCETIERDTGAHIFYESDQRLPPAEIAECPILSQTAHLPPNGSLANDNRRHTCATTDARP